MSNRLYHRDENSNLNYAGVGLSAEALLPSYLIPQFPEGESVECIGGTIQIFKRCPESSVYGHKSSKAAHLLLPTCKRWSPEFPPPAELPTIQLFLMPHLYDRPVSKIRYVSSFPPTDAVSVKRFGRLSRLCQVFLFIESDFSSKAVRTGDALSSADTASPSFSLHSSCPELKFWYQLYVVIVVLSGTNPSIVRLRRIKPSRFGSKRALKISPIQVGTEVSDQLVDVIIRRRQYSSSLGGRESHERGYRPQAALDVQGLAQALHTLPPGARPRSSPVQERIPFGEVPPVVSGFPLANQPGFTSQPTPGYVPQPQPGSSQPSWRHANKVSR
ncbi:hypothetical protein VNO77_46327 [Canavalia gladiata]|uniref:Uncharacterized protein n=1 Tax=Canavalia gladiata TaxID=3824 RepID=A0AAN9JJA3_CANGL